MAGVAGFEPTNVGTKSRCLTTWRHPNNNIKFSLLPPGGRMVRPLTHCASFACAQDLGQQSCLVQRRTTCAVLASRPNDVGTKSRCLTTWRHPNNNIKFSLLPPGGRMVRPLTHCASFACAQDLGQQSCLVQRRTTCAVLASRPNDVGTKSRCLTTWRHPNNLAMGYM